jgi:hypothetical protein
MFKVDGPHIVNERGKVLDVDSAGAKLSGNYDEENRNTVAYAKNTKIHQQWDIIYADEYPAEPKKGELNKDFGLYVERPFYIVSQLPSNRYLDLVNNRDMVIKTPNGRNTQIWYFHQDS